MERKQPPTRLHLVSLNKWGRQLGIGSTTAWRYRKRGWIRTVNIGGRHFVTADAVDEFATRARAGDFAKEPIRPPLAQVNDMAVCGREDQDA